MRRSPRQPAAFDLVVGVFAVGTPLAYAVALLVGMPAVLVLRRYGLLSRWALWAVGGCLGCVVSFGLAPYLRGELFSIPFPWWAGSLLGITSAEVFGAWCRANGGHWELGQPDYEKHSTF